MNGADPVRVTFALTKTWKGANQANLEVITPASSASCGFEFVQGQEYLVYAQEAEGQLQTNLCSRTTQLAQAGADLTALGEGRAPAAVPDEAKPPTILPAAGDATQGSSQWLAPIAGGVLLLIVLAAVVVTRRLRRA
jgi:hypothetical protein